MTVPHDKIWTPLKAFLAALLLGLAGSVYDRFVEPVPVWIVLLCITVPVSLFIGFYVTVWKLTPAQRAFALAWWLIVSTWPLWYVDAESPVWPFAGLAVAVIALALLQPVAWPKLIGPPPSQTVTNSVVGGGVVQVGRTSGDVRIGQQADSVDLGPQADVTIDVIDLAANAIEFHGGKAAAEYIAGRALPDHDYRFQVTFAVAGEPVILAAAATADDVVALIERDRRERTVS